ncbi:MAG: hypothetical protein HYT76_08670 [Deltaproteobacteria bacterium]|nr:hypothetical protein [Deltaproteobacteria bacterium]
MTISIETLIQQARLGSSDAQVVRQSFAVIEKPDCLPDKRVSACATTGEHHAAWRRLTETSPVIGLKLLSDSSFYDKSDLPCGSANDTFPTGVPGLTKELWNRSLAYRWVIGKLSGATRIQFLETTLSQSGADGLIFVRIARENMEGITESERSFLDTREGEFARLDRSGIQRTLAAKISEHLYYGVELRRETLSSPTR